MTPVSLRTCVDACAVRVGSNGLIRRSLPVTPGRYWRHGETVSASALGAEGIRKEADVIRWAGQAWKTLALTLVFLVGLTVPGNAQDHPKLDKILNSRAGQAGLSKVIITLTPGFDGAGELLKIGGKPGKKLGLIHALAGELSNGQLKQYAGHPGVESMHLDRPTSGELNRAAVTIGARAVQHQLGYSGAGVGVAVIDSGITAWHDDLTNSDASALVLTSGGQRVAAFVDFVNGRTSPYDDNGHGTHVAGTIAGNGFDSRGTRAGIAPAAHVVSLKVLDATGRGRISDVIAALGWAVTNQAAHNIRVVNLSVGAAVTESFKTDPLTLAAKRAVEAGIVVVAAAGNLGRNALGQTQYGGITAPANAPWVLTVGASSHEGTVTRVDDVIAPYSSRGPAAIDFEAKPDVVAPGTGLVSLSDPSSAFYLSKAEYLLKGTVLTAYKPYLSLTGTSMSAPLVSGTVALMLQANPSLTPNLVKAILQFTAQKYSYDALTQGAGFLNALGAVQLAKFFTTAVAGDKYPSNKSWSKQIVWGNHVVTGGVIKADGNAWALNVVWGSASDAVGNNIVWGSRCADAGCDNIVWGSVRDADNIVWGSVRDGDNIVWGSVRDGENIVWGSDCAGADCANIVWGAVSDGDENIVWGSAEAAENIVWGSGGTIEGYVWGTSAGIETPLFEDPNAEPTNYDASVFDNLFATETTVSTETTDSSVTGVLGGGL
jgi:serine protease AprX